MIENKVKIQNNREVLRLLKKQRREVESQLMKLNRAILSLEPMPADFSIWKDKAMGCFKRFNRYTQTTEILECVFADNKKILEDSITRKRHITALSVALLEMVKVGQLKSFKLKKVKGSFYGFPQWFNSDGSLNGKYFSDKLKNMNMNIEEIIIKT